MDKFKCDSCFHKKVCQESPAYGTVMEDCPSYINVEIDNSLQQLQAKIAALADDLELLNRDDFYNGKHVTIAGRMRQLSAVQ